MKKFQKAIALVVAMLLLAACLTGCGGGDNLSELQKQQKENGGFSVMIPAEGDEKPEGLYELAKERLQSLTEYPITWEAGAKVDGANVLRQQISAGEYPQVVIGNSFQPSDISQFAANGIILPIEDYINEKDTPNIWKMYQERPAIKAASVAPDGHIYTLPGLKEFMPSFIENVMYINKNWLDKVGMDVPTNLAELKEVLKAFKEKDPNGNGKADEIPLTFQTASSSAYPEVLLSSWGMATKFGSYDSWLTVQKGEVKFTPILKEWKNMLEYYRDLYAEGLLDMEAFTHDGAQFNAKLQSPTSVVGVVWSNSNPMLNADEYIAIEPLSADGKIKPVWRIHPGYIGTKDFLVIFKSCQNPQNVLKWADKFYELDHSIQNAFGENAPNSTLIFDEKGNVSWNKAPEGTTLSSYIYQCVLASGIPCWIPEELYGSEKMPWMEGQEEKTEVYNMYEKYLDQETWPRPYYAVEEADRLSELTTDIFSLTETQRAKWVCGQEELTDASWKKYVEDMKKMGVDEMIEIYQAAYDRYQDGMK